MGGCCSFQIACDPVLNRIGSVLCGRRNYILNIEKNLVALEKAMRLLKARRDKVSRGVHEEERRGLQRDNEVQVWLTSVQSIESNIDDLTSTRNVELQRLFLCGFCSKNLKSSFRYGRMIHLMLKEVENLLSTGVFDVVAQPAIRGVVEERPLQAIIVGGEMLERARNRLVNAETGIMGLYGMAGVGKTTLLAQINNTVLEAIDGVEIVIWVVVSSDLHVEEIQDEIATKLGLRDEEWDKKEQKHKVTAIHTHMKKKKFVLLLDDIWRKVDLTEIGVPFPTRENGCKVVFTTRSREVCGHMGVDDPMEVACLTKNEAWDLFKKKVGKLTLNSHPDIPEQARKVAEKCCGLPLALNVIGETMSYQRTIQEWHRAVHVLNSYAAKFKGMDDKILPVLKYSYDNLKGDQIKSCFLYCSLFSEDYLIEKEKLIDYWICEGMLNEKEDRDQTVNEGYEIIGTLIRACLLLEEGRNKSKVKMHDVVREMALWISSDLGKNREKCIVRAGVGLCEIPKVDNWSDVERISLMNNKIEEISGSPKCPKLTTLFLQESVLLGSIAGTFFKCMENLVVLDLSGNLRLEGLPEEISKLISLKYLDLSRTMLLQLPACLQKLQKLTHLYLDGMKSLQSIDGISSLSNLRTLTIRYSKIHRYDGSLKEVLLLQHLEVLAMEIKSRLVFEELFFSHMWWKCIQKVLIKDVHEESFGLLTSSCSLKGPSFPNLSYLVITECRGVKDLTWLLFAPNLTHLSLSRLEELEEVLSKKNADEQKLQGIIPFGKLVHLEMFFLPVVESIYWTPLSFPCLRVMHIELCPTLRKLPLDSKSVFEVEGFVIRHSEADWLEALKWEDEATRLRFLPAFT